MVTQQNLVRSARAQTCTSYPAVLSNGLVKPYPRLLRARMINEMPAEMTNANSKT